MNCNISLIVIIWLGLVHSLGAQIPAFPGAEGAGAASVGGRGGRIIEVTNLNNWGPGSFREAVKASGARTVIFRIGGTIDLEEYAIDIKNPYLTIAGQTAPGGGICIKNGDIKIRTHDVVVRYLRLRPGETPNYGASHCIFIKGNSHDIVLDHCSLTWASDENLTLYDYDQPIYNITIQDCIISEGLYEAVSSSNNHAAGPTIGSVTRADLVYNISIHRNLMSHNQFRNPYAKNKNIRVINNVVYYWERWGMMTRGGITADIIGNKFKVGAGFEAEDWKTDRGIRYTSPGDNGNYGTFGEPSIYLEGNVDDYYPDPDQDNWEMIEQTTNDFKDKTTLDRKYRRFSQQDFEEWPVRIYSIPEVENSIIPNAGASRQLNAVGKLESNQDKVDQRIINQYFSNSGKFVSSVEEAGGYPILQEGTPYADSDHDGMADIWETAYGFDKDNAADGNQDADGDGYTNVEEFLNGTIPINSSPASGTGLTYALYDNKSLSGSPVKSGTDATVNFNWQSGGKTKGLSDHFSLRWTGQVQPKYSETYTFSTRADDGTRLWVNGKLLIDDWTNHAVREKLGKITLQAGKKYDIKLEYYENRGKAVCKLLWKSPSQSKQIIPKGRLYPASNTNARLLSQSKKIATPFSEGMENELVKVYPNPVSTDYLTILLPNKVEHGTLILSNLAGQEILRKVFTTSQLTLPRQDLPTGTYILRLRTSKLTHTQQLIIP